MTYHLQKCFSGEQCGSWASSMFSCYRVIFLYVKPRAAGGSPIPKCRLSGSAIMFLWHNLYWYTGEGKILTFLFLIDPVFLNTRLAYDFFACICRKYINIWRGSKFKGRHPHPRNTCTRLESIWILLENPFLFKEVNAGENKYWKALFSENFGVVKVKNCLFQVAIHDFEEKNK